MVDSTSYLDPIEQTTEHRISLTAIGILLGALFMLGVLGASLVRAGRSQPTSGPAPEFTLWTFDGNAFSLSEQRGQIVIINFWASWCVPCRDEAPILQDTWQRYRDRGVVLVGVDYLDVERDALAFIDEFGITYPNGLDMGKIISKRYRIKGVPETFVVDQNGDIVDFYVGPAKTGQLDAVIERELQGRS
jgi:cytochrome c biogenesis protein CcmG/thiol:disulfide interchange protein DsbE